LTKPGHAPARQQFMVASGQTVPISLALHPVAEGARPAPSTAAPSVVAAATDAESAPGAPQRDTGDGNGGYRTGFWVTLGAGLVSAGAAVKFGLDVAQVNKDLDKFRRFPCPAGTTGPYGCNASGVAFAMTATDAETRTIKSKTDEGRRDQTLQWVFIGVGSALGLTAGYFLYKGYLDADDAGARGPRTEARRGLRIFPTAGASSGGVLAEFDF
jgi:hypothetical protein